MSFNRFLFFLLFLSGIVSVPSVCAGEALPGRNDPPLRILSLSAAATGILTALESPPAAIDEFGKIAAGKNCPPVLGQGSRLSMEQILQHRINCVVMWDYRNDLIRPLQSHAIRVERIPPLRLREYPGLIRRLGALCGKEHEASALCLRYEEDWKRLQGMRKAGGRPVRVLFLLYSPGKSAGDESYPGDLIRAAGGQCVTVRSGTYSQERIVLADPEVIFYIRGFSDADQIAARPELLNTSAVRSGRIHPVDRRLITEGLSPLNAVEFLKRHLNQNGRK